MNEINQYNADAKATANDQPYYKKYVASDLACPFCDAVLYRDVNRLVSICDCGVWRYDAVFSISDSEAKNQQWEYIANGTKETEYFW